MSSSAHGSAAYVSIWQNLRHRSSGKVEFSVPGFPDSCRFHMTHLHRYLQAVEGTDEWSKNPKSSVSSTAAENQDCLMNNAWNGWNSECSVLTSHSVPRTVSPPQMMALAMGLEDSGKLFIWAIRTPFGFDPKGEFKADWESLSHGVPIIGWPLAAEQGYNSKMIMEEMGVGIELTGGLQSHLQKEDVEMVINTLMEKGGNGEEMKRKALEIR
ncbi:UDP-glycosyltransferase 92A1-like [Coffea eugenioides]|uniref:UDP-glycosyltransferase 92A1-like n=1 Tax=Coffea eugenioides TaxID=49369 RepID=UPI000F6050DA|nr:UDP-glycosyltransferase 92A1-like [Coffea eugenioides]